MQLALTSSQRSLLVQVRMFLDSHWPSRGALQSGPGAADFHAALNDRGWSVPSWPRGMGGTGWSPLEGYLFERELARVGAPLMDPFAVDVLGPLLIEFATPEQQNRFLPLIRSGSSRFVPHRSLRDGNPLQLPIAWNADLDEPAGPADPFEADWLLALVGAVDQQPGLGLIGLAPSVVAEEAMELLGGPVGEQNARESLRLIEQQGRQCHRARASRLQERLARLVSLLETIETEPGLVDRMNRLAVSLMSLDALEQRAVAAATDSSEQPFEAGAAAVRLRCADAAAELAALAIDALGYYALPAVDAGLFHNEGPVGPLFVQDLGQGAIEELLGYVGGFEGISNEWADRDLISALLENRSG